MNSSLCLRTKMPYKLCSLIFRNRSTLQSFSTTHFNFYSNYCSSRKSHLSNVFYSYCTAIKAENSVISNHKSNNYNPTENIIDVEKRSSGTEVDETLFFNLNFYFHSTATEEVIQEITSNFSVIVNFITEAEEEALITEIEPHFKRLRYEMDHWDDAIVGFRETEIARWSSKCSGVLQRLKSTAFTTETLPHTHVLDLHEDGYIKAHVDSVRFCGSRISGISLLTSSVMRLAREKQPDMAVDIILPRRSLYIMRDDARYKYTHAVLGNDVTSVVDSSRRPHKTRRISVICRSLPPDN